MAVGAGAFIRPDCAIPMSSPMPAFKSTRSRSTGPITRFSAPILSPDGDETPEGFVFPVKGSRFITHLKQLRDIETPLANFFASGVLRLEEKLGPFVAILAALQI
jgi:hypothetical protein